MRGLPWLVLDIIYVRSEINLSFRDRLKVLLGRKLHIDTELTAYPGHPHIGGLRTEVKDSRTWVEPWRPTRGEAMEIRQEVSSDGV